jgi:hypothetical protein
MSKIATKKNDGTRIDAADADGLREKHLAIGSSIINAWKDAFAANPDNPRIDRHKLISDLKKHLLLDDTGAEGNQRRVELDVVVDSDLDQNTRLVWLAIPTLDVPKGIKNFDEWLDDYFKRTGKKPDKYAEELGGAVLFGCGK